MGVVMELPCTSQIPQIFSQFNDQCVVYFSQSERKLPKNKTISHYSFFLTSSLSPWSTSLLILRPNGSRTLLRFLFCNLILFFKKLILWDFKLVEIPKPPSFSNYRRKRQKPRIWPDGRGSNPTAILTKLKSSTLCLSDNQYSDG